MAFRRVARSLSYATALATIVWLGFEIADSTRYRDQQIPKVFSHEVERPSATLYSISNGRNYVELAGILFEVGLVRLTTPEENGRPVGMLDLVAPGTDYLSILHQRGVKDSAIKGYLRFFNPGLQSDKAQVQTNWAYMGFLPCTNLNVLDQATKGDLDILVGKQRNTLLGL